MLSRQTVDQEVAALGDLAREELAARWEETYGSPPPKGARRELLLRAATWHLQVKRLGGIPPETRRNLKAAVDRIERGLTASRAITGGDSVDADSADKTKREAPGLGSRLIRDWNGRSHVVDVIEDGFVFEGRIYKSLSAIARLITGAHWSGPRFFGL